MFKQLNRNHITMLDSIEMLLKIDGVSACSNSGAYYYYGKHIALTFTWNVAA